MDERNALAHFEAAVLPHLAAAYNLARWLTRDDQDARDAVQEASLRAWRFFGGFRGGDGRSWLLTIVRNVCHDWLRQKQGHEPMAVVEEEVPDRDALDPQTILQRRDDTGVLRAALEELPVEMREVLVLRELEELSYKEIAAVTGLALGTVMSRLARGRARLQQRLAARMDKEV